ncbi:glycosyltransferase family 2 protein [Pontiella agarivorans]|uniref:Glycosyltransferase family 2 protein n=1 Tax=Pontiella agarivorans TaxID=3038953 RepID=A0ABU5MTP4_9BACT|nr:glycosyltransferase family 2 protein [Pontiella agarivorans]MDZ8117326.1 glycosyltransferase family 2 protein [Pontiella agarivorans]
MHNKLIYVVVVTYNGEKWIREALNTLSESALQVSSIIIDNASSDSTVEIISSEFPEMNLITLDENLGFGKANNVGIRYALDAGADYVFLMNQDVYIKPDTMDVLLNTSMKNSDYSIISPIHLDGRGASLDHNFSVHITPPKASVDLISFLYLKSNEEQVYQVSYVNAAAWFMPKETLLRIGGFDPLFSHYGEDEHYAARLNFHDEKMGVTPLTSIRHDRIQFGNVTRYKKGLYYRQLLMGIMDVTKAPKELFAWFCKQTAKNIFLVTVYFLTMRFAKAVEFHCSYLKIIGKWPAISKSRAINKREGPSWL